MKYIKTYKQLNEGLRDKMMGKEEDDILKRAEHIKTEDKIFNGIKYDIFELVEMGVEEIKNDEKLLSEKGQLLLRFSVINGNIEATKLLLDLGLNVNYQKEILLRSAAFKQNKDMIDLLISYGADLDRAIEAEPFETGVDVPISKLYSVKFLKNYKENYVINEGLRDKMLPKSDEEIEKKLSDLPPNKLLIKSAESYYIKGIKKALKMGVNKKHLNDALILLTEFNDVNLMKLLIKNGADIQHLNNYVLRYSSTEGHLDIVKLSLEEGADVNVNVGEPVKNAVLNGHIDIVKLLLDHGAKLYDSYEMLLKYTKARGYTKIHNLLKNHIG